jgi:hypothetical protein
VTIHWSSTGIPQAVRKSWSPPDQK